DHGNVWLCSLDKLDGLVAIRSLGDYVQPCIGFDDFLETSAKNRMVVSNDDADVFAFSRLHSKAFGRAGPRSLKIEPERYCRAVTWRRIQSQFRAQYPGAFRNTRQSHSLPVRAVGSGRL